MTNPLTRALRRRTSDERGAAMPVVVMVVAVGLMLSTAIATSAMGSVRQTTHGRSNVQAFAAAEAGRDQMAAYLSQTAPVCPSATGTVPGAEWSAKLFVVPGTSLPSGTTYDADGAPQPSAAWSEVNCAGLAATGPGDYTVVIAATGVAAIDGTTRVLDAVYPFRIEPPDNSIVGTVQGPFSLGSSGTGASGTPAWSGGPLVVNGPPGQVNFTCGTSTAQPTIVDGDVYVLTGDANFPGPGCRIKGDLYVEGNIKVSGRNSLGEEIGGSRHLWVEGDVRVGRDIDQVWGGLTVGGSITAGRDINLNGHEALKGTEDKWSQVQVGKSQTASDLALWAGRNVNLTSREEDFWVCGGARLGIWRGTVNGRVRAVGAVRTHEYIDTWSPGDNCKRNVGGGRWSVSGTVTAGTNVVLKDTPVGGVTAGGAVTATENSPISGTVTAGGAVQLTDSAVSGAVRTASDVTATRSTISGKVTALGGSVRLDESGSGEIAAKGNVVTSGAGTITGPVSAEGSINLNMNVNGDVRANENVTLDKSSAGAGITVTGSVSALGNVHQTGGTVTGDVTANGHYQGTSSPGLVVGGRVVGQGATTGWNAGFGVVITDGPGGTRIGTAGTAATTPAIWSARKISLRKGKESTTPLGTVHGAVRTSSTADGSPRIEVQRTWQVTGQLQSASNLATPTNPETTAVVPENNMASLCNTTMVVCVEGKAVRTNYDRKRTGCYREADPGHTNRRDEYTNPTDCENAPKGISRPCGLLGCEWWVDPNEIKATDWPTATTGALVAPVGAVPLATAYAAPTSIPGVTIPPTAPNGPTNDDIAVSADGTVLLDAGHWLDLSYDQVKAAAVESGYTTTMTFGGNDCKRGWGGISDSRAEREIATALSETGKKYLVDTTGCTDALTNFIAFDRVNSDAVFLVKNYKEGASFSAGTNGTVLNPRRLYFIQPDSQMDREPTCNNNGAAGNTQPSEQTGRAKFEFSFGSATDKIHTMIYSPCGLGSSTGATNTRPFYGQVLIGASSTVQYTEFHCRPMALGSRPLFNLTCGGPMTGADVDGTAGVKTYFLGVPTVQTEP